MWWSPPMAVRSGLSITSRHCGKWRKPPRHRIYSSTLQNPPSGAMIDYYLPAKATGPITMEILDSKGAVVRHLSSVKSNKAEQPPEWPDQVHPTETLPGDAGGNGFVWDVGFVSA